MALELFKALLTVFRYCTTCEDCKKCPMREMCGKAPQSWDNCK